MTLIFFKFKKKLKNMNLPWSCTLVNPPYFHPANKVAPAKGFPEGIPPTFVCQSTGGGVTKVHNHGKLENYADNFQS